MTFHLSNRVVIQGCVHFPLSHLLIMVWAWNLIQGMTLMVTGYKTYFADITKQFLLSRRHTLENFKIKAFLTWEEVAVKLRNCFKVFGKITWLGFVLSGGTNQGWSFFTNFLKWGIVFWANLVKWIFAKFIIWPPHPCKKAHESN